MRGREPGHGRQVTVPLVKTPALDLGQSPQALGFEHLDAALQRPEILLQARIGYLGDDLRPQRRSDRSQSLEHMFVS